MAPKENDRTRMTDVQDANSGPVFQLYKDKKEISEKVEEISATQEPYAKVHSDDDIEHTVTFPSQRLALASPRISE